MNTAYRMALACSAAWPIASATPAWAQDMPGMDMSKPMAAPVQREPTAPKPAPAPPPVHDDMVMDMPGMDHGAMAHAAMGHEGGGSGTSRLPLADGPMQGIHLSAGDWMLMVHATVSAQYTSDTGPRGDDKAYATSMAMVMATRQTDWGKVQLKAMGSLEPFMRHDGYPNLFATGEEAYGKSLVDHQHPHDLFMELAARVDVNTRFGSVFIYGGPVAEPALGPSAFMHRASARLNPEAPITHHWFDSTHITYGVVTGGLAGAKWQIEGSAFRGQEPDEHRFNIETPRLDSWSLRGTLTPSPAWAIQASYGFLKQPEAGHPGEDERRFTASAHYANGHGLSAMAGFSAKKRVVPGGNGPTLTAFLGEAEWDATRHDTLFGRIENVDNDELFPDPASLFHDRAFRVTKFQVGYARRYRIGPVELAAGGSVSAFAKPALLDTAYARHPMGYTGFVRLSLAQ
jgi:hypothetical protein